MALYKVLFSGLAGGLVAYAAVATVAGAAALLVPAEHDRGSDMIVRTEPRSPAPTASPTLLFKLTDEGKVPPLVDGYYRDQQGKLLIGVLA